MVGTTTSTLLAAAIFAEGVKNLAALLHMAGVE